MVKNNGEKLITWNVNGLRAVHKKGFLDFIEKYSPDVLALQEIKVEENQVPEEITALKYHQWYAPAKKKGYSGVALFSKVEPIKVEIGVGVAEFDDEGRTIVAEFKDYILFACYFPNGQRDHGRVPYKLAYSEYIMEEAKRLHKKTKKTVLITGDVNTSHQAIDLANPKQNEKTTGFLPIERAWLDKLIANGFVDTFRDLNPDAVGAYTWWTYRGDCRERNIGWRLDYFFATKDIKEKFKFDVTHLDQVMGSDHCPVVLNLRK